MAETALRPTNLKFERRFGAIEDALAVAGKTPAEATLTEMDAPENMQTLFKLGELRAERDVRADDFPTKFDLPPV